MDGQPKRYRADCTVVVQGLDPNNLQQVLDYLQIAIQTPIGSKGHSCFLNFASAAEAQAAASQLHNFPSPIDPAACLRATIKFSPAHAQNPVPDQQGLSKGAARPTSAPHARSGPALSDPGLQLTRRPSSASGHSSQSYTPALDVYTPQQSKADQVDLYPAFPHPQSQWQPQQDPGRNTGPQAAGFHHPMNQPQGDRSYQPVQMLPVQHPANKEGYIADGQPHYSPMAPAVVSSNQYWEGQPDIERQPHAVPTQFASGTHGQAPYVAMGYPANAGPKQFPPHQDVYQQEQVLPSASHQPYFGVSTAIAAGVPQPRRPTVVPGSVAGPSLAPPDSRPQDQSSQPFQPVGQSVAQLFQPNSQTVTQPTQLRLPAGQPFYPASRPAPQPAQPRRVFAPDCTMVIESSQAHKSESAVLAAWAAAGAVSVHVTTAADIAYVNFVSSAQAAAAVDKLNSRQKSDAGKSALKQRAMLKSTQQSYQQLSCQAYLAAKLTAVDEAHFSAAGILLLHRPSKGKPEVLLGHETIHHCRLSMLGGKREKGESSRIAAAREFQEETAYQLESALHLSRQQTSELLDILLADSQVIWLGGKPDGSGNAKYALYLVDICQGISKLPKFQHLQATLSDRMQRLCVKFASSQQHSMWRPINQSEMQSLEWVPLSSRSVLSAPTQSLADFLTMVVKGCQPLRQWAVDVITEHIPAKLQAQVRAAQQQAHLEKPSLHAAIAKLSVAIPPPAAPTTLTDLVTVQPGSAEYNKVKALMSGQVHEIKRVVVPERKARFDAWGLHLASKNASWQKVTKVFHGTNPPAHASGIARKGPDFSRIGSVNGAAYGRGFYTSDNIAVADHYASGNGGICLCEVLQGNVKSNNFNGAETAGSLFKQGFHSVHDPSARFIVLFHPDAVCVTHIANLGPDSSMDQQLAAAKEKLDAEHKALEMVRIAELKKNEIRKKMITYFVRAGDDTLAQLNNKAALEDAARLFDLEEQQFNQNLPMYAEKEQFLADLHASQCIVLRGGTGIGKSVTVPQWVYDHHTALGTPVLPVAVLVPRRAIAEGLSKHVSEIRGCKLGEEVGLGMGGTAVWTTSSRIVFMTYGFFMGITISDQHFSRWGAVILDEAHERKKEADQLLVLMAAACKVRPKFKVVVMSATIEPSFYVNMIKGNGVPGNCPALDVEGVTFPVKDVWWEGEAWDPQADTALMDLALECSRVYLQSKTGHVLVFVSTVGQVKQMVKDVTATMAHDKSCIVLGLYGAMSGSERAEVSDFSTMPKNKGKRMICISTNVAEAGVTIAGISAVVETGWQNERKYDPITRVSSMQQTRISKASQMQRRGRAGRTQPGTCYTLYTQADFNNFPDDNTPDVLKSNLDAFLLGMVAADLDPTAPKQDEKTDMELLNHEELGPSLARSREHLIKLGALKEDSSGKLALTDVGEVLVHMPLEVEMGLSIIAANGRQCSEEVAIIGCMAAAGGTRVFRAGQGTTHPSKTPFAAPSGDHETYLNVYEAWLSNNKSQQWCDQHGLHSPLLEAASEALSKVHRVMGQHMLVPQQFPGSDMSQRSEAILQSLCAGYFRQLASAADPNDPKGGFWLVEDYDVNPKAAALYRSSVLSNQQDVHTVLFGEQMGIATRQTSNSQAAGSQQPAFENLLVHVSKVEPSWVVQGAAGTSGAALGIAQAVRNMERQEYKIRVTPFPQGPPAMVRAASLALQANAIDLRKEFPLASLRILDQQGRSINTNSAALPDTVVAYCPSSMESIIHGKIQQAIQAVQVGTASIDISAADATAAARLASPTQLDKVAAQLRQDFKCCVLLALDAAKQICTVSTLGPLLPVVVSQLRAVLGLPSQLPQQPAAAAPQQHEQRAIQALLGGSAQSILQDFGRGKLGSMMALTRLLFMHTKLWIYGGFIRDAVIRGETHDAMDLDVGLPLTGMNPTQGMAELTKQALQAGLKFVRNQATTDSRLCKAFFQTADGTTDFEVQVVDSVAFARGGQKIVDFNVNNLKLSPKGLEIKMTVGVPAQGQDLDDILQHIRAKKLLILHRPPCMMRIDKMQNRGWRISN